MASTLPAQGEGFRKTPQELAAYNAACPKTSTYYARIFKFVHRGTKEETFHATNEKKMVDKFKISFEFITHPTFVFDEKKGPQPWTAHVESKLSTDDRSNLYKWIKSIFQADPIVMADLIAGKFKISSLLNRLVMIEVEQKISKPDARNPNQANLTVKNILAPMVVSGLDLTGYQTQKLYNELVLFDVNDFIAGVPADREAFKKLYAWEQKDIFTTEEVIASRLRLDDFKTDKSTAAQQSYNVGQQAPSQDYRTASTPENDDFGDPATEDVF